MKRGRLIRISVLVLLLLFAVAGAGNSASSGSSTVTVAAAPAFDITVAGSASISSTAPPNCGTTSTTVNVKSNKAWNLQIRANSAYPNGKPMNGAVEMVNALQWQGGSVVTYTNITTTYVNMYTGNQPKTTGAGVDVNADYQQCVDWADDPATYTIVVEYLGVQP